MVKSGKTPRAIKRGSLIALATVALSASQPLAPSEAGQRAQAGRSAGAGNANGSPSDDGVGRKQTAAPKRGGFTGIPGRPYTGIPGRPYR